VETLPKPYNYLFRKGGYRAGSSLVFRILAWQEGQATITPKATGQPIDIPVYRLFMQRLDRPSPARYYDISSRQVQAQLFGYLFSHTFIGRVFAVDAHGYKPSKQFSVRVMPESA
jgi:hypothetical protein